MKNLSKVIYNIEKLDIGNDVENAKQILSAIIADLEEDLDGLVGLKGMNNREIRLFEINRLNKLLKEQLERLKWKT